MSLTSCNAMSHAAVWRTVAGRSESVGQQVECSGDMSIPLSREQGHLEFCMRLARTRNALNENIEPSPG